MATHPPVHVLDDYYLAITLIITVAYQLIGFSIAFTFKFDKITDFMGGSNFVILAIITLAMGGSTDPRQIVTSIFIMLWAARLSGFLLFRILKTGKDDRFDDKRDKFLPFLGFWVFQMLWVWTVSLPVTILNSPNVLRVAQPSFGKATDIIGIIIWALAFGLETVSDAQKYRFKQGPGQQPGAVCDVGFFKLSRHPNYFAEIMTQVCTYSSRIGNMSPDCKTNTSPQLSISSQSRPQATVRYPLAAVPTPHCTPVVSAGYSSLHSYSLSPVFRSKNALAQRSATRKALAGPSTKSTFTTPVFSFPCHKPSGASCRSSSSARLAVSGLCTSLIPRSMQTRARSRAAKQRREDMRVRVRTERAPSL